MVAVHDGGGPGRPPLPAGAGPNERALYEIYDFQSGIVSYTASQWTTTAEELTELAASVRKVVSDLRNAPDGEEAWSGAAAEAAYESLGRLAINLDRHSEDVTNIEGGLTAAGDAVADARIAYGNRVRTVDIDIDQSGYMTTTPAPPVGPPVPPQLDQAAYDQAVSAAKAQREAEAAAVMSTFETRMESAAKKLPVEPAESPVTDNRYPSGGGGGGGNYPTGSGPSGGSYVAPTGGGGWPPRNPDWDDVPVPPDNNNDGPDEICTGFTPVDPTPDPVVLDGDGDGTLGPGTGTGPLPGTTGPGGTPGGGGLGAGGTAFGMGGMIAGGGAAALMGRGGPGGAGALGRGGVVGVGSTGAAGRGGTGAAGRGGTGGTGRSSVVAGGGGQSGAGRGTGGRGGGGRTGRYGVPQLGERGARGGVSGVAGSAGSRGGKDDKRDPQDVDHLTHEDEETWFEGADQASNPVWE